MGGQVEEKEDYCLAVCDLLLDSIDWFPLSRFFFLNFREPVRNPTILLLSTRSSPGTNINFFGGEKIVEQISSFFHLFCCSRARKVEKRKGSLSHHESTLVYIRIMIRDGRRLEITRWMPFLDG